MVKVIMSRSHSGRPSEVLSDYEKPLASAIRTLIEFELGFGGKLAEVNEKQKTVSTVTVVFACVDRTTVICKTDEEFKILLEACYAHQMCFGIKNKQDLEKAADKVLALTGGNALMITHMSGPLIGGVLQNKKGLHKIIFSYAMIAEGFSQEEVVKMLETNSDDEIEQWINAACAA